MKTKKMNVTVSWYSKLMYAALIFLFFIHQSLSNIQNTSKTYLINIYNQNGHRIWFMIIRFSTIWYIFDKSIWMLNDTESLKHFQFIYKKQECQLMNTKLGILGGFNTIYNNNAVGDRPMRLYKITMACLKC